MIENLLIVDGIEYLKSNFDYHKKENVIVTIEYNSKVIDEKEIIDLGRKFNQKDISYYFN